MNRSLQTYINMDVLKDLLRNHAKFSNGNDDEDSEESEEFLETPICESTFSSANDETFQQLKHHPYEVVHTTTSDSNDKDTKHGRRDDCPNLNEPVEERLKGEERFGSESSVLEFIRRTCRFRDDKQRGQMAVSKTKRSAKTPTVGNEGYINYNFDNSSDDYEADENQSIEHDKAERSLFDFLKQKLLHRVEDENETTPIPQHSKNSYLFSSDLDRSLDDSKTDKVDCLTGKNSERSLFQFLKQRFIPSATEEHEKEKLSNCNDSMGSRTKPMRMGNDYSETFKLDFLKQKLNWSDGEANREGEANITAKLLEKKQRIEMSKQRRYTSPSLEESRLSIHDERRYINKNTVPQRNKCVKYPKTFQKRRPNLERQSVPYEDCPKGN